MDLRKLVNVRRKRKERADVATFAFLIATPSVGQFAMPANGRLRFVATAGAVAGALAATLTGASAREIRTPVLAAGGAVGREYVERGTVVTPSAGYDVELDCGFSVWRKIGGA